MKDKKELNAKLKSYSDIMIEIALEMSSRFCTDETKNEFYATQKEILGY